MFSIYSHVKNRNRARSPDAFDSDAQTPTPPPTFPPPRPYPPATVPRPGQASSLPGPNRPSSRVDLTRNSAPAFTYPQPPPSHRLIAPATILFPSKASEPSTPTSDEEEAAEAPAIEEFLAGDSPDRDSLWAKEAIVVKREVVSPSQLERPDSSPTRHRERPEHSPITPPPPSSSRKEQIFNQHRGFLLCIKRSLRGRVLSNAPVGDRSRRSLRFVSPFTVDDLEDFYQRRRRASAEGSEGTGVGGIVEGIEVSGIVEGEDSEVPKIRKTGTPEAESTRQQQLRTPELRGTRQRPNSSLVSSRHTSIPKARVEKTKSTGIAARRKSKVSQTTPPASPSNPNPTSFKNLATMLTTPTTPDIEIAPLVTTWTQTLLSKIDTLNSSVVEKDEVISSLEREAEDLESKLEAANGKVRNLQVKLGKLETSTDVRGEVKNLKGKIEVLVSEKKVDQQKVQNLNQQLSTLVRQAKVDRKAGEKREIALMGELNMEKMKREQIEVKGATQEQMAQEQTDHGKGDDLSQQSEIAPPSSFPSSGVQGGGDEELRAKYDALEKVAREVARHCGLMAGDNFGPFGSSLAALKRHMGE